MYATTKAAVLLQEDCYDEGLTIAVSPFSCELLRSAQEDLVDMQTQCYRRGDVPLPLVPLPFGVVDPFGLVLLLGSVVLFGAAPLLGDIVLFGLEASGVVPFVIVDPLVVEEPFMSEPLCVLVFLCLWCFDVWVVAMLPEVSVEEPCWPPLPEVELVVCAKPTAEPTVATALSAKIAAVRRIFIRCSSQVGWLPQPATTVQVAPAQFVVCAGEECPCRWSR